MKKYVDYNFKFDENGRQFSKPVENAVGKKEKLLVASNFSFSHSVFKKYVLQTCKNKGLFGKGLKGRETFQENGQNFILFPQCLKELSPRVIKTSECLVRK